MRVIIAGGRDITDEREVYVAGFETPASSSPRRSAASMKREAERAGLQVFERLFLLTLRGFEPRFEP